MATKVKKSQVNDAVGALWAALAVEKDPRSRGIGTLLVEARAGGGGGRGERGERMLKNKNNGRIRWQLTPEGRTS